MASRFKWIPVWVGTNICAFQKVQLNQNSFLTNSYQPDNSKSLFRRCSKKIGPSQKNRNGLNISDMKFNEVVDTELLLELGTYQLE